MDRTQLNNFKNRFVELESLRGLAALTVILYHLPKWNPILDIGFINNGYLMVEFFFVLSGFVISHSYHLKIYSFRQLIIFQYLRFSRLFPVHLLFLLLFLFLEILKLLLLQFYNISSPNSRPFSVNDSVAFIKHLFLFSNVLPNEPLTFNFPSWSICVEFYTYLLFALLLLIFKNSFLFYITSFIIAIASMLMLHTHNTFGNDFLLRCFAGFFLGCCTFFISKNKKFQIPELASSIIFVFIIIFLQFKIPGQDDILIYFLSSLLVICIINSNSGFLNSILRIDALAYIGTISYSLYMSHAFVQWVANQYLRIMLHIPEVVLPNGISTPQLTTYNTIFYSLVTLILNLLIAYYIYNLIEQPCRIKSRLFVANKLISMKN